MLTPEQRKINAQTALSRMDTQTQADVNELVEIARKDKIEAQKRFMTLSLERKWIMWVQYAIKDVVLDLL